MARLVPSPRKGALERIVQYRNRAEELRLIAASLRHPDCRARVLKTVNSYLEMAELVEESILCRWGQNTLDS